MNMKTQYQCFKLANGQEQPYDRRYRYSDGYVLIPAKTLFIFIVAAPGDVRKLANRVKLAAHIEAVTP